MLICGRTKSHHYYVVGMSVDHLFVNSEDPTSDVWRVTVGDMFDCEDLAVLLGASIFRPERGVGLKLLMNKKTKRDLEEFVIEGGQKSVTDPAGSWIAENDDSGAVMVVDQGPDVGASVGQRPLRHDVLAGMSITLK